MQANANKYKEMQAHASKCKQMQGNVSKFEQMRASTNKCNQIQANVIEAKQKPMTDDRNPAPTPYDQNAVKCMKNKGGHFKLW